MTTHEQQVGRSRDEMAMRLAQDIPDGSYVNLGIGIPELVAKYVPEGREFIYHTENGLLGMGPSPEEGFGVPELINAGKRQVTSIPGASFFHHADSFAMIRGGHVDLTVLGAFEVDCQGNIASYMIPGKLIKGMGGAMDLVAGARRVIVTMTHCSKHGDPKILESCTLPLTGQRCVDAVVTDRGWFDVVEAQDGARSLVLREIAPGETVEGIRAVTGAPFEVASDLVEFSA